MATAVKQHPFQQWVDLASRRLGGQVLACNDDFFAEMENLIKASEPVFIADKYTDRGKWMDGWESRRKRLATLENGELEDGSDWAVLKLGAAGRLRGFNVCTRFFAGNAPQQVKIEGCISHQAPDDNTEWHTLVERQDVQPDSDNYIDCHNDGIYSHLRLTMFPDGGIARLRAYGQAQMNSDWRLPGEPIDLAYVKNGARPLACSDMFFSDMSNLIMPGRGVNMGDGWETKRRRGGRDSDWMIIKLATRGNIAKVLVDTAHFKGNYPDGFALFAIDSPDADPDENADWQTVISRQPLTADAEHFYRQQVLTQQQCFTHVKIAMYPDGGISRLRVYGYPDQELEA